MTTDPEQMVQLIQIEQGPLEAELRPQLFNSNVNQGEVHSRPRPGAQHIVRLDSQQMELLPQDISHWMFGNWKLTLNLNNTTIETSIYLYIITI